MNDALTWFGMLGLGALHGINPAMGWLFAVALGLQERDRVAVWRALGPLALGHALAIGAVVLLAAAAGLVLPAAWLKLLVAAALIAAAAFQWRRHRHPRFGGMRMSLRDLTIWSFLMASAHGAGLMVLPLILNATAHAHAHGGHVMTAGMDASATVGLTATLLHTVGYLLVSGGLAVVVYEKVGLRILRRAWINIDLIWIAALIVTGIVTALW